MDDCCRNAAQAAREEERAIGPCGKHPRACYGPEEWGTGNIVCGACDREASAVEEARINRDNEWFERDPSFARAIGAMGAEFGWDGQGKVTEWLWLKLKRTRQIEQRIAEAEARVRRESVDIALDWLSRRSPSTVSTVEAFAELREAILRGGERG